MQQFEEAWRQFEGTLSTGQNVSALTLSVHLILGGVLALYVRMLYRRCSNSPSDTESITRVFPLLTLVTTGVIAVVKSSLALSLGLVGALSIVRFRAAIKEPEELVYLFLCIAIGLALGAEQPLLAVALVIVATLFIVGMYLSGGSQRRNKLLLTITSDSKRYFEDGESTVLSAIEAIAGSYTLQRLDVESGRSQVRVVLRDTSPQETVTVIAKLHERLPDCEVAYVNLNSML
jgi:hypothetical protein